MLDSLYYISIVQGHCHDDCLLNCFGMLTVAFRMYDLDNDGNISRDELLSILSMMVGSNISEDQVSS